MMHAKRNIFVIVGALILIFVFGFFVTNSTHDSEPDEYQRMAIGLEKSQYSGHMRSKFMSVFSTNWMIVRGSAVRGNAPVASCKTQLNDPEGSKRVVVPYDVKQYTIFNIELRSTKGVEVCQLVT